MRSITGPGTGWLLAAVLAVAASAGPALGQSAKPSAAGAAAPPVLAKPAPLPPAGATAPVPAAPVPAAPAPQASAQPPSQCPDDFEAYQGSTEPLTCACPADSTGRGAVWGTDVYTGDSAVCRAAVHAGIIPRRGGVVTVIPEAGRTAYPGTTRNGFASMNYGRYAHSYRFQPADGAAPATPGQQAAAPGAPAAPTQCPDDFTAYKDTDEPLTCLCPAEATGRGAVWGTDVYTGDSALCRAAVHAGVIPRRGGQVTAIPEAGRNAYPGTTRNGFASMNYGRYDHSYRFQPAGAATGQQAAAPTTPAPPAQCPDDFVAYQDTDEPLTCACPAEATSRGAVWGTDIYTADSALCRAAVHAGAIRASGGLVVVTPAPGRSAYPGTTRNGFASMNYGPYDHSYRIQAAGPGGAARPAAAAAGPSLCPDNFDAFRDTDETLACLCPAEATSRGALWGTDTYTTDSGICRAAVHAGVIPRTGGPVTVVPQPGRNAYPGTTRNGITSSNYGAYRSSYRFDAPVQRVAMGAPVQAPVAESLRATGKVALYVTFRTGSADLDISAATTLGELRDALQGDPSLRLVLIGHTDNTGTPQGNVGLSQRRAEAVRAWLVSQGIAADRLAAQGRGQAEPVAENTSESGRALNRRVQAERRP
ncbi:OmpA family protein [Roseomonas sp. OT10]|uniref:LCCL domain-containing protein n=1 Tax=Roseomonas cutis TaxID=2897332 RepID=UPI001E6377E8|nr:LCCL domain-containing protein [Roseomonas sp. OT10]UFN47174.1 OmpA family protein [Roseomonas sp. OT10]